MRKKDERKAEEKSVELVGGGWGWLENEKKKRCKGSYEDETG